MRSAGNDIVSLSSIDRTRTLQPNYFSKILLPDEQALHQRSVDGMPFEEFVWMAWSVKESAFKYIKRLEPELTFIPAKIVIEQISLNLHPLTATDEQNWEYSGDERGLYAGVVKINTYCLHFRAIKTNAWIASVVNAANDFEAISWVVRGIDGNNHELQSARVREFALESLRNKCPGNFAIEKSTMGYPIVCDDHSSALDIPLSFSHHGTFVSFVINKSATLVP